MNVEMIKNSLDAFQVRVCRLSMTLLVETRDFSDEREDEQYVDNPSQTERSEIRMMKRFQAWARWLKGR